MFSIFDILSCQKYIYIVFVVVVEILMDICERIIFFLISNPYIYCIVSFFSVYSSFGKLTYLF